MSPDLMGSFFEAVRACSGLTLAEEMRSVLEACKDALPLDSVERRMTVSVLERAKREACQ